MASPLDAVLDEIEEYLERFEDVRDGPDGPRPNEAMRLLTDLRYARAYPEPEARGTTAIALLDEAYLLLNAQAFTEEEYQDWARRYREFVK